MPSYGLEAFKKMIWKKEFTLEKLNALGPENLITRLGIRFSAYGDDWMEAEMPVDNRTVQPFGLLHGGATAALIETLASVAGNYAAPGDYSCLGVNIEVHHLQAVKSGIVTAHAEARHIGSTMQVWLVTVTDSRKRLIADGHMTLAVRKHMKLKDRSLYDRA